MELIKFLDNPVPLMTPCEGYNFNEHSPEETAKLAKDLVQAVYDFNGIGISANQVGVPWAIFAMRGTPEDFVCFNPRVVMYSDEKVKLEEACLSFPGLVIPIIRSKTIRVRFAGPNGEMTSHTYTGITARCFLHEFDHLQGRLWFEGCNRFHLERAIRNAKHHPNKMARVDYSGKGLMRYAK